MNKRILTAYFSMKGETLEGREVVFREKGHAALVAEYIQKAVGGDLFEIETVEPYPDNHLRRVIQARTELEHNARPELKRLPAGFDRYDTVFLSYPIWWFTIPMPVASFLERLDWTGKKLIPVNTSNSSGAGNSDADIRFLCGAFSVETGLELRGQDVQTHKREIQEWAVTCLR